MFARLFIVWSTYVNFLNFPFLDRVQQQIFLIVYELRKGSVFKMFKETFQMNETFLSFSLKFRKLVFRKGQTGL